MLFKFRIVDSPRAMLFLQQRVRDVRLTLLFPLEIVSLFWNDHEVKSQNLISAPLDIKDIFFAIVHAVSNNFLINYIL